MKTNFSHVYKSRIAQAEFIEIQAKTVGFEKGNLRMFRNFYGGVPVVAYYEDDFAKASYFTANGFAIVDFGTVLYQDEKIEATFKSFADRNVKTLARYWYGCKLTKLRKALSYQRAFQLMTWLLLKPTVEETAFRLILSQFERHLEFDNFNRLDGYMITFHEKYFEGSPVVCFRKGNWDSAVYIQTKPFRVLAQGRREIPETTLKKFEKFVDLNCLVIQKFWNNHYMFSSDDFDKLVMV